MRALVLEDVRQLAVREVPRPQPGRREVLVRVGAVGFCGSDFHIFNGAANYHLDAAGQAIPLAQHPQILGHEFSGTIQEVGAEVNDLRLGDRVVIDQGLNCNSQARSPLCEYCQSGDSHQCDFYKEHGITGLPGAMTEFIAVPAVNAIKIPQSLPLEEAAFVEPLACVLHAMKTVDNAQTRYGFGKNQQPIQRALILGAGPAGLLFVQIMRQIKKFAGSLFIADLQPDKLQHAGRLGAQPINIGSGRLVEAVRRDAGHERMDYLIDACGAASVFAEIHGVMRKQGTLLMYAYGREGADLSLLNQIQFIEARLITSTGASGPLDTNDGRPVLYREAMHCIAAGTIRVKDLITHRYRSLQDIPQAFIRDCHTKDYIKGMFVQA